MVSTHKTDTLASWEDKFTVYQKRSFVHPFITFINKLGMERFKALGFPARKDEKFTYVNTKPLEDIDFKIIHGENNAYTPTNINEIKQTGSERSQITLVNGMWDELSSNLSGVIDKIRVKRLGQAVSDHRLKERLNDVTIGENDIFASLNSAFLAEGIVIDIRKGETIDPPLEIINIASGSLNGPVMTTPRILINAGGGSKSNITFKNVWNGSGHFSNMITEFALAENAEVNYVHKEGKPHKETWNFNKTSVSLLKNSRFNGVTASRGSTLSRTYVEAMLHGESSSFDFNVATSLDDDSQAHFYLDVHHLGINSVSAQLFKNLVKDKARVSVDTTVTVHHGANGSESNQLVNNLLLSNNAHADTKPNLKIYTDDVQCAHGATTGQINEEQLFYMRSRGIGEAEARRVLTVGFLGEALGKIGNDQIENEMKQSLLTDNGV